MSSTSPTATQSDKETRAAPTGNGNSTGKGAETGEKKSEAGEKKNERSRRTENTSSGAASSSTAATAKPKKPKKPSLLSRLLHALVPCAAPSPNHPVEIDPAPSAPTPAEKPDTKPEPLSIVTPTPKPPTVTADGDLVVPPTPTTQLLPQSETEGVTSGAVQPPGSTGTPTGTGSRVSTPDRAHQRESILVNGSGTGSPTSPSTEVTESDRSTISDDDEDDEDADLIDPEDDEDRLIMQGGAGIPIGPDGVPKPLLPPIAPQHAGRKCLVLDLDETLVHSSFKSIQQADYVVPVEIEYHWHNVYVIKRPGVDNFLKKMGEQYEVVVFTASLSKYADPVLDKLDIHQVVTHRLFRESCYNHKGNYVKDLSQLGRPIADTIILDNSPASYIFHPNNAVPVSSWFNDPHDTELTDLIPFLGDLAAVEDVRGILDGTR